MKKLLIGIITLASASCFASAKINYCESFIQVKVSNIYTLLDLHSTRTTRSSNTTARLALASILESDYSYTCDEMNRSIDDVTNTVGIQRCLSEEVAYLQVKDKYENDEATKSAMSYQKKLFELCMKK